jgi:iron complex outermembrane recepter protein
VAIDHDHQFYGDRLTLHSDARLGSRRNRLVVGVESNRNDFASPRRFGSIAAVDPLNPLRGVFPADTAENFPGPGNRQDFTTDMTLVSLFAEDAIAVAPRVTIVGGVHYDRLAVDRRIDDLNVGSVSTFDRTFNAVSSRGGVVVDVLPRTQVFGQYSRAVAPVATLVLISQANAAFTLTTGTSWEGGVKSTLAGGRVDATASIFTITQDDIVTRDPNNFNVSIQGGTQASTGVELTVAANVTRNLRVDANASFLDARFETLLEAGGISRAGNVPPNVPERTSRLWASYRIGDTPMTLAGGLRFQGRFFTNNANSTEIAGFTLLDAQASWRISAGEITLRGRNLTDALYADWTGASANQVLLGAPRTVDLSYFVRF